MLVRRCYTAHWLTKQLQPLFHAYLIWAIPAVPMHLAMPLIITLVSAYQLAEGQAV